MKAIEVYKSELTERYTSGPVSLSSVEEEEEEEERGGGREGAKTASVKEDGGGEENEEKEGEDSKKQSSFEVNQFDTCTCTCNTTFNCMCQKLICTQLTVTACTCTYYFVMTLYYNNVLIVHCLLLFSLCSYLHWVS